MSRQIKDYRKAYNSEFIKSNIPSNSEYNLEAI